MESPDSQRTKCQGGDVLNLRHPFILDAEGNPECAACGKYGHARIHKKPHELTREETEHTCELLR